ncbi:Eco57I restriction-modification methylase domain-containing protein [Aerococcus urinaeequi]|uniref:Eco57I restriction-modification methylase domain-containing protein n=1 Tax=Aerococcus urinaeequi TaxID=51665 RepID=UPI003D6ABC04
MPQINRIDKIDSYVKRLRKTEDKWMSLAIAVDIADEIMKGIIPDEEDWHEQLAHNSQEDRVLPEPLPLDIFKTQKQATWFVAHPILGSARVALSHFNDEKSPLESRLFWFSEKETKQKISATTQFLSNWEDSNLTRNENYKVAIDFFLSYDTNTLMMVVTNRQKLRVMEFTDSLSNTQKQILAEKLFTIPNIAKESKFSPQESIHNLVWDAFQLKEVNNKFYQGVSNLYNNLVYHLQSENEISAADSKQFSSRLLGRLLFIWFLRKMDLINEDMGYFNTNGMTSTEYYESYLKPLFFHTLNTPISKRNVTIEDDKTPYLNGGLFDIKDNDFYNQSISFPENYFERLYAHFNEFNFTVDESSVDYELVAVDPEMLGQIFESLLASHNENDDISERKETGSYYTPRQIVDYMSKQSIRQYLYREIDNDKYNNGIDDLIDMTDAKFLERKSSSTLDLWGTSTKMVVSKIKQALDNVKIIDPAVGSGAFPMGMLQIMSKLYERILPTTKFNSYQVKLNIIENNIYGIDLQPMATEISRLRAWLAIVVEDHHDNQNVSPLPNLEFKFISANSLVELETQGEIWANPELEDQLSKIRQKYFRATTTNSKKEWQNKYYEITRQTDLFDDKRNKQLKTFDPFNNVTSATFFNSEIMFGIKKGNFDIVIGNPPYLLEGRAKKSAFKNIVYYQGKMDLWYSFACLGIDLLSENGVLSFIAKNNWTTNAGASILRNKVVKETRIHQLIDFGNLQVFEHASQQTMIMIFIKNLHSNNYNFKFTKYEGKDLNNNSKVISSILEEVDPNSNYLQPIINRENYRDRYLVFSEFETVFSKMIEDTIYLKNNEATNGIHPHYDFINTRLSNRYNIPVGTGVFGLSRKELENLNLNNNEKQLVKPYYTTSEIARYYTEKDNNLWIIYTDSSFKKSNSMNGYPNLKKHLDKFQHVITSDNSPYGLHRARKEQFFVGEKIAVVRKSPNKPIFSYSDFDCYLPASFYIIQTKRFDMQYLLGLLNSKLIAFWLKHNGKMQGDNYQLDKKPLTEIPLKKSPYQKEIIVLVNEILSKLKEDEKADISNFEQQIDRYIYMTYNISEDEIDAIDEDMKR